MTDLSAGLFAIQFSTGELLSDRSRNNRAMR
jgi:hypothetical protein